MLQTIKFVFNFLLNSDGAFDSHKNVLIQQEIKHKYFNYCNITNTVITAIKLFNAEIISAIE